MTKSDTKVKNIDLRFGVFQQTKEVSKVDVPNLLVDCGTTISLLHDIKGLYRKQKFDNELVVR